MRQISATFFKGLVAVLPAVVTLYLLYWLGSAAEAVLGQALRWVLPDTWYLPGSGLVAGVLLVFAVGVLLNAYLIKQLWELGEGLMRRIPVVKTIYGAVQDLMGFFKGSAERGDQVVVVRLGDTGYRLLGIVTRQEFDDLPEAVGGPDTVAVYTPMSYQVGGYTLLVPRDAVEPVEMGVEDAMRFAVTAGMSAARRERLAE